MAVPSSLVQSLGSNIPDHQTTSADLVRTTSAMEHFVKSTPQMDRLVNTTASGGQIGEIWSNIETTTISILQPNASFGGNASLLCGESEARKVTLAEGIACMISLLTVLENIFILAAITRGPRSLRKPPYWFIASLAAADLLTGIEVVLAIFVPVGTSPLSRIVLKGMAVVTFIVSINSLLLVSFDRYLRIAHHTDYERILTRRRIIILIALAWIVSFAAFLVAPLLGWSCAEQHCCPDNGQCVCKIAEYGEHVCNSVCSQSFVPFQKSYILAGVIYFLISIVVMVVFYTLLFKVVQRKTFGNSRSNSSNSVDSKAKKREVQLTKTLVITLGIFTLCWLPVMVLFLADFVITYKTDQLSKVFDYALVPSVINSLLNPIIYSVRLPRMRQTVQRIALPCIYGRPDQRFAGATWATNTSCDRSIRRKSVRKLQKLKGGSEDSSNGSSRSMMQHARSRLASNKSFNSEMSASRDSAINVLDK